MGRRRESGCPIADHLRLVKRTGFIQRMASFFEDAHHHRTCSARRMRRAFFWGAAFMMVASKLTHGTVVIDGLTLQPVDKGCGAG